MDRLTEILEALSKERPLFHSESDFQHALAWKIHEEYPDINIRLERREIVNNEDYYLDIYAFNNNQIMVYELKYKTKLLNIEIENETFNLRNHGAQDQGRYDFLNDISRLERVSVLRRDTIGFAIFLTNDESYWTEPQSDVNTADQDFRIHEGRIIKGTLSWREGTSEGTISGRVEPIILDGTYELHWKDYSNLECQNGKFRFLLVEIKR